MKKVFLVLMVMCLSICFSCKPDDTKSDVRSNISSSNSSYTESNESQKETYSDFQKSLLNLTKEQVLKDNFNLSNSAFVCVYGDYVIFVGNHENERLLICMKKDGSEKRVLLDESFDWMYINCVDNRTLWVNADGFEKNGFYLDLITLKKTSAGDLTEGEQVNQIYCEWTPYGKKISLYTDEVGEDDFDFFTRLRSFFENNDGKRILLYEEVFYLSANIADGYKDRYILEFVDNKDIYQQDITTGKKEKVFSLKEQAHHGVLSDKYLLYFNEKKECFLLDYENNKTVRVNETLSDEIENRYYITDLRCYNEYIYYSKGWEWYQLDLSTNKIKKLPQFGNAGMSFLNDKIYWWDGNETYRTNPDGTNTERLWP